MDIRKREKLNNDDNHSFNKKESSDIVDEVEDNSKPTANTKNELSLLYWICLFICLFILFDLAIRLQSSCDLESDILCKNNFGKDESDSIEPIFNDTLAREHLQAISRLGRRPTGSTANEVHTPSYIIKYVNEIINRYSSISKTNLIVTVDEHVSKLNSFSLVLFGKYHISSIYDQVRSVVVRIHDSNSDVNTSGILFNCHYDSFFGGIGASDDLASCVVMLESLHALVRHQPVSLRNDVVLLFNGAEENILQASHAFVTQHPWSSIIKLVVNLEAAGSGGRQMLFQTSEQHPWLAAELGRVLQQPFASVIGQEIFSANLIPSDTDYRIFRDFGHVAGVDLAFIANGYVYHTSYDVEQRIPQTCLRHTGRNILRLVTHLANLDAVRNAATSMQRVVFFDFFGLSLVSYTEFTGTCFNLALVTLTFALIVYYINSQHSSSYFFNISIAVLNQVTWLVTSILFSLLLGFALHQFGYRMTWYSNRYNVICLFLTPLLWYFFFYHSYTAPLLYRIPSSIASSECNRHAAIFLIALVTLILTLNRLLSCYFVAMWIVFGFLNELLACLLKRYQFSDILHFLRDSLSYSLPMTYYFYMVYTLYDVFIPILGRSGPSYPDIVISLLTGIAMIIPGLLFTGNFYMTSSSSRKWIIFLILHFSISCYIFILSSQLGFPYNQSEITPRKQRIFINHVTRNIRNSLGQTQVSESGLWILSLDTNNVAFLKSRLEQVLKIPMQDVFCELRPYCGYPLLLPFAGVIDHSLWIPQSPHKSKPSASILILNKIAHISGMVNVTLQINGPSHCSIYIMTPASMRIVGWSLGPDPPRPIEMPSISQNNYKHYFIYYGYGDRPATPLTIWLTFLPNIVHTPTEPPDQSDSQIEIALAAHYLLATTDEIETMLHLMPKWTVPTTMTSSYEHIVVDLNQEVSFNQ